MPPRTVLAVGDLHFPFVCTESLKAIYAAIKQIKPDIVVQCGDLYDYFSLSRFPKRLGVITPEEEVKEARQAGEAFWRNVQERAPKASCYQISGNHCQRPIKLVKEKAPELHPFVLKSWQDMFKFKGVSTLLDDRDDLEIDGVVYEHGFYSKPGQHMRDNMKPTVLGHTHRPWIHYEAIRGQYLFEMNIGYVADPTHEALSYSRKKWHKWVKGYGVIENGIPSFIPIGI